MQEELQGIMCRQIESAWRTGELIGFHRWADEPDAFLVGFVQQIENDIATFLIVDPVGRDEGPAEVPLADIEAIQRGTAYLAGINYLHGMDHAIPHQRGHVSRSPRTIVLTLQKALEAELPVTIRKRAGGGTDCLVRALDSEFVMIEVLLEGIPDGLLTLHLESIRSVAADGERQLATHLLYQASQGLDEEGD